MKKIIYRLTMLRSRNIFLAKHCTAAKPEMVCLQAEFDSLITQSQRQTPAIDRLRKYLSSC
jgi:hypothetical protein